MANTTETQEDRIRTVFGLPSHALLPTVSKDTLPQYHEYLLGKLSFPFQALYIESTPPVEQLVRYVTVVGLSDNHRRRMYGLFCKVQIDDAIIEVPLAELGMREEDANCQLVDDYCHWLWNSR
jgi:hypothetical protein